jgi:hypothetical protein
MIFILKKEHYEIKGSGEERLFRGKIMNLDDIQNFIEYIQIYNLNN